MSNRAKKLEEVRRLASELIDSGLVGESARHLSELMRDDPEACEVYLDQLTLHVQLQWELGGEIPDYRPFDETVSPARKSELTSDQLDRTDRLRGIRWPYGVALAVLAAIVSGVAIMTTWPQSGTAAPYVARLTSASRARWGQSQSPPIVGQALKQGEMELLAGLAEVELFDGAVVAFEGPCRLTFVSTNEVALHTGSLSAAVSPRGMGFTVETPVAAFVDRGTSFGVRVDSEGATSVQVFEGLVEVSLDDQRSRTRHSLTENTAARIKPSSSKLELVAPDSCHFPRPTRRIRPLVSGDFESGTTVGADGIPITAGYWTGDVCEVVSAEQGLTPHHGARMLRFISTNTFSNQGDLRSGASSQWQLVDLRGLSAEVAAHQVKVHASAQLNRVAGNEETDVRMGIAIHAFRGDPDQAAEIWEMRQDHKHRMARAETEIPTDRDPATWEEADVRLCVPRRTDYLIVELRAVENVSNDVIMPEFEGHYADTVQCTVSIKPISARTCRRIRDARRKHNRSSVLEELEAP